MKKWNLLSIIEQKEDWIAVSKPSGMASIPERDVYTSSLIEELRRRCIVEELLVVHRLDKDTSGLILFATNKIAQKELSLLFQSRSIKKTYLGIVAGVPYPGEGSIEAPIASTPHHFIMRIHTKGKPSTTHYKVLQSFGLASLVEFTPLTGRTHQIRLHAKYIGHPLLCDELYGDKTPIFLSQFKLNFNLKKNDIDRSILDRLALHSHQLEFIFRENHIKLQSPLFKDMEALILQLSKIKRRNMLQS